MHPSISLSVSERCDGCDGEDLGWAKRWLELPASFIAYCCMVCVAVGLPPFSA